MIIYISVYFEVYYSLYTHIYMYVYNIRENIYTCVRTYIVLAYMFIEYVYLLCIHDVYLRCIYHVPVYTSLDVDGIV